MALEPFVSESNFAQQHLNDWSCDQFWSPDLPEAQIEGESKNQVANEQAQNKANMGEERKKFALPKGCTSEKEFSSFPTAWKVSRTNYMNSSKGF